MHPKLLMFPALFSHVLHTNVRLLEFDGLPTLLSFGNVVIYTMG